MSFRFCRDKQLSTLADAKGNYSFKMHLLPSQHFIYILLLAQGGSKEHSGKRSVRVPVEKPCCPLDPEEVFSLFSVQFVCVLGRLTTKRCGRIVFRLVNRQSVDRVGH